MHGEAEVVVWEILVQVVGLLGAALLLGVLFERFKQSAILGYLLAGTLLGPHVFGFVDAQSGVPVVAELGVSLLLFAIGLEFSLTRLLRLGPIAAGGGSLQVILTLSVAAGVALMLGLETKTALAIGAVVALSSTACVLRLLTDRAELDSVHGRTALGVLLLQDVAVVPLLLLVTMLGGEGTMWDMMIELGKASGLILALVVTFWWISNYVLPRLLKAMNLSRDRELLILLASVLAIGSACAAHALHLSPALGAFIAGMMLAGSPFATQIRSDVGALKALFITLFFVSVGMLGDPVWIAKNILPVASLVLAIIVGKSLIITITALIFRRPLSHSVAAGLSLAQVGEFGVVIVGVAHASALIDNDLMKLLVSATLITLFATPLLVRAAIPVGRAFERILHPKRQLTDTETERHESDLTNHVILIGFGPSGRHAGEELVRYDWPALVIDLRPANVDLARSIGLDAVLGDATNPDVLLHHGLTKAAALVITIPDHRSIVQISQVARHLSPDIEIIARGRYHALTKDLEDAGASVVVNEEFHVGRRLAAALRAAIGRTDETSDDD